MRLKYFLAENYLTERQGDYSAMTSSMSLGEEEMIASVLKRGTLLTRTDVLAVWNAIKEFVVDTLAEGDSINLPLFNTSFSISGVFDGPMDTFDGNRHKLNINLTKGVLLREAEKRVKFEKENPPAALPQIQEVKDSVSGSLNECLTVRGIVEVRGYNLKIDGDDPSCGLWFVAENGAAVKAEVIAENKPAKIIALIPDLTAGNWQVKVVTQHTGSGTLLKTPKVFVYPKFLTVQ
jgi:hypothetical protein